ncbi:hypothetical protein L3Y34_002935 [Caenorhabditis briggsae]|uniref:Uncharacterized protein n=2 Tax=Caenorhabditis briggsae TaxID=6238 RepID=A0AAE9AEA9_CAEBR|nr:hypothetical protein L3Y34_002935 [Caenorhabditis briggsae]
MRMLIYSKFIALILYSVLFAATQCYHLTNQALYNNCDLLNSVRNCAAIRIPQSVASTFFQIFFGAASVSTTINMFSNRYHDSGLSYLLVLLSLILACSGTVPSYFVDAKSDKYMLNCASFEHKRSEVQKSICFTFLLNDVVSGAATIIVSRIGKWKMSDPRLKLSITQKHRMANVKRSNILILPNVILNLFCYIGYVALNLWKISDDDVVDGNEFLWVNTVPIYVFFSPFVWEYSLKHTKMKDNRDDQPTTPENMAKILTAQWEKIDKNKERGNFFKITGSGFIRVFICCWRNKTTKAAKRSTENSTQIPGIGGNIPENSQVQQNHRQTIGRNEKVGCGKAVWNFLTGKKTNTVDVSVGYVNYGSNNNDQEGGQIFFRTTQNV